MQTDALRDAMMPLIRQAVAEAMAAHTADLQDAETALVREYGETVSVDRARKILRRGDGTVTTMVDRGLLAQTADGRIAVRSIARYLATPPEARPATRRRKYDGEYNV